MPCEIPITSRIPSKLQLFAISTVVCIMDASSLSLTRTFDSMAAQWAESYATVCPAFSSSVYFGFNKQKVPCARDKHTLGN